MKTIYKLITPTKLYPKQKTYGIEEKRYIFRLPARQKMKIAHIWVHTRSYKTEKAQKQALRDLRKNARYEYEINGQRNIMLTRFRPCKVKYFEPFSHNDSEPPIFKII